MIRLASTVTATTPKMQNTTHKTFGTPRKENDISAIWPASTALWLKAI